MRLQWYLHQRFVTRNLWNMHAKYTDSLLPGNVKAHFWGEHFAIHIPQSKMLGCIHIQHSFSVHFLCIRHIILFLCGDRGNKMQQQVSKTWVHTHFATAAEILLWMPAFTWLQRKVAGRVSWPKFLCPKDLATLIGEKRFCIKMAITQTICKGYFTCQYVPWQKWSLITSLMQWIYRYLVSLSCLCVGCMYMRACWSVCLIYVSCCLKRYSFDVFSLPIKSLFIPSWKQLFLLFLFLSPFCASTSKASCWIWKYLTLKSRYSLVRVFPCAICYRSHAAKCLSRLQSEGCIHSRCGCATLLTYT